MSAVIVDQLYKAYGKVQALDGVSFSVNEGELYGIIGPDGAGKTTLFRILTTLMLADRGQAQVKGCDVARDYRKIRNIIGYMPGKFSLYQDLTVEENLQFFATVFNTTIEENYHLIADIYRQIEPFKHRMAGKLSGGMKQKLALSCALIHKPEVLFLDEPTTGVDPVSRKEFWGMLLNLKKQGITILVSTPYMDEATLCDRIALVQGGAFLEVDTPQGIVVPLSLYAFGGAFGKDAPPAGRFARLSVREYFVFVRHGIPRHACRGRFSRSVESLSRAKGASRCRGTGDSAFGRRLLYVVVSWNTETRRHREGFVLCSSIKASVSLCLCVPYKKYHHGRKCNLYS